MKNILITGAAGFIGTNLISKLLKNEDYFIVGVDNFSPYYDIAIKNENIQSNKSDRFEFIFADITDEFIMRTRVFDKYKFDTVIHLAAQAGVGYSINHSLEVIDVNIKGFDIMIRLSHDYKVNKFIFASSSTVLGNCDGVYRQKSPYGVTKATNEAQAKMYAELYKDIKIYGLRLYTVYGDRMRPDLAIAKFTRAILNDEEIHIYGDGTIKRDFTYIDDVTEAFKTVMEGDCALNGEIYDVGNGKPTSIANLIDTMKTVYDKPNFNKIEYENGKPYDAILTNANGQLLEKYYNFKCKISLEEGLKRYKEYLDNEK